MELKNSMFDDLPHDEEEIVNSQIEKLVNNFLGNNIKLDIVAMTTELLTLQLAAQEYKQHLNDTLGIDIEID